MKPSAHSRMNCEAAMHTRWRLHARRAVLSLIPTTRRQLMIPSRPTLLLCLLRLTCKHTNVHCHRKNGACLLPIYHWSATAQTWLWLPRTLMKTMTNPTLAVEQWQTMQHPLFTRHLQSCSTLPTRKRLLRTKRRRTSHIKASQLLKLLKASSRPIDVASGSFLPG